MTDEHFISCVLSHAQLLGQTNVTVSREAAPRFQRATMAGYNFEMCSERVHLLRGVFGWSKPVTIYISRYLHGEMVRFGDKAVIDFADPGGVYPNGLPSVPAGYPDRYAKVNGGEICPD